MMDCRYGAGLRRRGLGGGGGGGGWGGIYGRDFVTGVLFMEM